jgi:hypothetical protein
VLKIRDPRQDGRSWPGVPDQGNTTFIHQLPRALILGNRASTKRSSRKPRARECVKGTGVPVPLPTGSDLRLAPVVDYIDPGFAVARVVRAVHCHGLKIGTETS